jgi:hypothetical protein
VSAGARALPDVSMLADVMPGYDIYCSAHDCRAVSSSNPWIAVGGTSAAAPLLAGGLALIDQLLREHGKQDVGLANSLLYEVARRYGSSGAINDITTNDNDLGPYLPDGDHRPLGCCSAGPGFDYASGLGSVDLNKLAFLATALEPPIASVGLSLPPQTPVAGHHLVARLSCSRRCVVSAAGTVSIAGGASFGVGSLAHVLAHAGRTTVKLAFSSRQLAWLRRALATHRAIYANVVGEVLDSGGSIEARSRPQRLRIRR